MMFGRQHRLLIDIDMGITLDDNADDFVKLQARNIQNSLKQYFKENERLVRNRKSIMIKDNQRKCQIFSHLALKCL